MIIPRFSLRWLLALTTVCAGVSFILSYAFQRQAWAIGMLVGLASLILVAALHAASFSAAWLLTQMSYSWRGSSSAAAGGGASPFAAPAQQADPEPPAIMS